MIELSWLVCYIHQKRKKINPNTARLVSKNATNLKWIDIVVKNELFLKGNWIYVVSTALHQRYFSFVYFPLCLSDFNCTNRLQEYLQILQILIRTVKNILTEIIDVISTIYHFLVLLFQVTFVKVLIFIRFWVKVEINVLIFWTMHK